MSKKRKKVLDFVSRFIAKHGYSPTYRVIGKGVGLSSPATVHEHIQRLIKEKYLRLEGEKVALEPRALGVGEDALTLPLLGEVQAGIPIEVYQEPAVINVPEYLNLTPHGNYFVLKVRGESMIDEGIRDGDFVVCENRHIARDGEVVVALVGGTETTLKTIYRDVKKIMFRLQPANTMMDPIFVREVDVQGIVKAVFRRY